ncbi:MAG: TRAP transporter small permease [Sneathiella sp.]
MNVFIRSINSLSTLFGILAAMMVGMAILVVCEMVVVRYFLNGSTVWQTEFVTFSIVAATFMGSPYVLLKKGHVNVDLLPHYLPPPFQKILAIVASLLALVFCAVLGWQSFEFFYEAYDNGWVTDTVWELPLWIPYLPMFAGLSLLTIQYIAEILSLIFDINTTEENTNIAVKEDV